MQSWRSAQQGLADLDLQEGVCDAAHIVLSLEAAGHHAAQDPTQSGHVFSVHGDQGRIYVADLQHEGDAREHDRVVPVFEQRHCPVLEALDRLWNLAQHPAEKSQVSYRLAHILVIATVVVQTQVHAFLLSTSHNRMSWLCKGVQNRTYDCLPILQLHMTEILCFV